MEHDDPMYEYASRIEEAEREAANLFTKISEKLDEDEARRIFTKVLKRPRGKRPNPRKENIDGHLRALQKLGVTKQHVAEYAQQNKLAHSVEAAKQRMKPSRKKSRDK